MEANQWTISSRPDPDNQPWSNMCKNREGWGPFSKERVPDFTPCFEDTAITLIPYAYILLAGLARFWILSKRETLSADMTKNWLYFAKMTTLFLMVASTTLNFFLYVLNDGMDWIDNAQILTLGVSMLVLLFVTALHYVEYTRNRVASGVLLFYWLFVIIVNCIKLRTYIMNGDQYNDPTQFRFFAMNSVLAVVIFILENIERPKSQYIMLEEDELDSPEEKADIFSRLTFSWMTPLMRLGYKKPLTMDDLWNLKTDDQSAIVGYKFQQNWEKESQKANPSLLRVLVKTLGGPYALSAFFKALQDILQFTQPMLLKRLMVWVTSYASDEPEPAYRGVLIAVAMFFTAICQTMFLHQYFQRCFTTGMRLRAALVTAIYQKTLVLSNTSRQKSTVGEIVNHMSVDAQRLMDLCTYFHIVWSGPLQIIIALFFLYNIMGPSIGAGVGVLLLAIPLNTYIARKMRTYQKAQMGNKDARVKLMNEILNGIRVIKLYAWETPFMEKISFIRNDLELATLKKIGVMSAVQSFTWTSIPFLVTLSTFTVFVFVSGRPLTSDIAFVAISLFGLLQFPITVFPNVISSIIEASVSLYRIENYLSAQELDPNAVERLDYRLDPDYTENTPLVEIDNGSFKWNEDEDTPILKDIDLKVKKGQVAAIVGRVGSGKSTIISALLGDTIKINGRAILRGSVAYVPQQPWVMNATLRDNIVFGHRWDPEFYDRVLEACSLKRDLEILSGGDLTEIGERGINLSGGQKARVSLARAIYARADIYLLDDPLSAVDAHVGRHIFDNVIGPEGILKNKARVLVTHGISYLHRADQVVMLREGQIILSGNYSDLMNQKSELYALIADFGTQQDTKSSDEEDVPEDMGDEEVLASETASIELVPREEDALLGRQRQRMNSEISMMSAKTLRRASLVSLNKQGRLQKGSGEADRLITVEESAKGSVTWSVYKQYVKSCSVYGVISVFIFLVLSQVAQVGTNIWLKYWSSSNQDSGSNNRVWFYLTIYAIIGWSSTIFAMLQTLIVWVFCAIRSARVLHSEMLETIVRSPMAFFDTTPLGRILNRFSKDQHTVDEILPRIFHGYFRVLFSVIATVCIIAFSTPLFMVLIVPLGIIYIYVQRYYLATSRELKRLDSVGKSPIYSHFQETISGVSTIRAYGQQKRFMFQNECKLDDNQRAYFPSISCNRWLAVRLEFLGSIIIFSSALFAVIGIVYGSSTLDAGLVGLSVSYALNVTQALNWVIRSYCEIETNIVSVERIKEYIDLPTEKYNAVRSVNPMWPEKGLIEFRDYATRYRPGLDLALRNLSFTVAPKEKIGIVGRTGAGKSSLSLSLFRIVEAAKGSIYIDDVDISSLRLFDLRSRLTIIPQDPVLFAGTVRENLDPFGAHEDADLWNALELSHLKEHISKMDGKLNAVVLEGGDNFSVGQRQLICLARALLRRTTVLVLDEATAAIDVETDAIIQETIRRQFANCTILTIAHRINTVLDSDRILVLDKGMIAEFDSPQTLMKDETTIFYSMAKEAGLIN
ncbi:MAG: multi drug resistance-associated protein MRP [Benjaminiella poitrasii]|nr:MAG: multi drug resistance-associated protein MRP [Benjaminiella poitrasii]